MGYQVRRIGSYYTTKEMDSLRIKDRRTWYRYSEGKGGDAIDFMQHFEGMTFPEAVDFLLVWNGRSRDPPDLAKRPPPVQRKERPAPVVEPVPFVLPPANEDTRRVTAYLKKRGIIPAVIRGFVDADLLYEEEKHHNCVFVGTNSVNEPVYAAQRGTYDGVNVFEAPIDLMPFCSFHRDVTCNALALCGLYEGPLDTYLREYPGIKCVFLCLDGDGPGKAEQTG